VKLSCKDFNLDEYGAGSDLKGESSHNLSKFLEKDILTKISEKLA
jgi:hypothetical protein